MFYSVEHVKSFTVYFVMFGMEYQLKPAEYATLNTVYSLHLFNSN